MASVDGPLRVHLGGGAPCRKIRAFLPLPSLRQPPFSSFSSCSSYFARTIPHVFSRPGSQVGRSSRSKLCSSSLEPRAKLRNYACFVSSSWLPYIFFS